MAGLFPPTTSIKKTVPTNPPIPWFRFQTAQKAHLHRAVLHAGLVNKDVRIEPLLQLWGGQEAPAPGFEHLDQAGAKWAQKECVWGQKKGPTLGDFL